MPVGKHAGEMSLQAKKDIIAWNKSGMNPDCRDVPLARFDDRRLSCSHRRWGKHAGGMSLQAGKVMPMGKHAGGMFLQAWNAIAGMK